MELDTYRNELDKIDAEIISLFERRMDICAEIGEYKLKNNLPVTDEKRESEKLSVVIESSRDDLKEYTCALFNTLFTLSKNLQEKTK